MARAICLLAALLACPGLASASEGAEAVQVVGIPLEFIFFGLTLLGVALFHHKTLQVALGGLAVIALYKILFSGFKGGTGLGGFVTHLGHEWVIIANLLGLLVGFALLARHFEESEIPKVLPRYLPDDWQGAFALLAIVFVLSAFLDNIAAALIGGAMAHTLFRKKVHIGYIAAIVAAANAGGSGSVVGDTTTTMMWIHHVPPGAVLHAYVAALMALVIFGIPASLQQQKYSPILKHAGAHAHIDWPRVAIVGVILAAAVAANVFINLRYAELGNTFPFIAAAVWLAILMTMGIRKPEWSLVPGALRGAVFLLALVLAATMMPVEKLPAASWQTALGLGFLSAVFDNIPLTAMALKQGNYDWGMLAYAVGFGGSMIWFGSSAGVAISTIFPEAKSVGGWLKNGWHVPVAYVAGFFLLLAALGWHPLP
ncbi:MAG: citrate transporter [Thermoanaerobaculia bacterium]